MSKFKRLLSALVCAAMLMTGPFAVSEEIIDEIIPEDLLLYSAYIYVDTASWDIACDILSDPAEFALYAGLTEEEAAAITVTLHDGYLTAAPASAYKAVTAALRAADLIFGGDDAAESDHKSITRTDAVYVGANAKE